MLFIRGGKVYHGAEAIHVLGCLSSRVFWFNQLNRFVFSKPNGLDPAVPDLEAGTSDGTVVAREEFDDPALS